MEEPSSGKAPVKPQRRQGPASGSEEATPELKNAVLIVATLASFLMPFMISSVNIAVPTIGRELSMDAISLSWISTGYLLASALFLLPLGRLADIKGRKKVFTIGTAAFTIFSFLSGSAPDKIFLLIFRFLEGVGASMMFGVGVALITSVFPPGERGKAIGINTAAVYFGLSTGPFFGGFLTQNLGWRSVFYANVPLGALMLFFIFWRLKGEWAGSKGEGYDLWGAAIYSTGLAVMVYGLSLIPSTIGYLVTLLGILGLVGFMVWEAQAPCPLLDVTIFKRNAVFTFSNLAALVSYASTYAVTFLLSLYLQIVRGFGPQTAGLILVSQSLVQAIFSPISGRLSDRIEPRIVASVGMALDVAGLVMLAFLTEESSITYLIVALVLLGCGFGLFSSPNTNAVMTSVDKRLYGVASATLATVRIIGQILSMAITMVIFQIYIGHVEITPAVSGSLVTSAKLAFSIFSVLCVFGVFASLARGSMIGKEPSTSSAKSCAKESEE